MISLIVLVLILIGSPATVGADVIMTLHATSGSLTQFQDVAFRSEVFGPGGFAMGGFTPLIEQALPVTVSNLAPLPGQLIDQSGTLNLYAPHVSVSGHQCCLMTGA